MASQCAMCNVHALDQIVAGGESAAVALINDFSVKYHNRFYVILIETTTDTTCN